MCNAFTCVIIGCRTLTEIKIKLHNQAFISRSGHKATVLQRNAFRTHPPQFRHTLLFDYSE